MTEKVIGNRASTEDLKRKDQRHSSWADNGRAYQRGRSTTIIDWERVAEVKWEYSSLTCCEKKKY